jgi:hypothetical protein
MLQVIYDWSFGQEISTDNKDFNGSIPTPNQSNQEELEMKREDEPFFEDDHDEDEEDEAFPDEDTEDEDYAEVEVVKEDETPFADLYGSEPKGSRMSRLLADPWPRIVFVLTIIGLGVVLLTPPAIWAVWNYFILSDYFLIVLVGVAVIFSLVTWSRAGGHRLRWAGPTSAIVALLCGSIGTLDSANWMLYDTSLIAGVDTPLIPLCMVLTLFSLYTLWAIQRNFGQDR